MSVVYFIQAGDGGPIKIGFALDAENRLAMLQTGNPATLRLLAVVPGTLKDERRYHRLLADDRIRGEWFAPNPSVLATVGRELRADCPHDGMRSHREIVDAVGPDKLSVIFGVPLSTTRSWSRRSSIPAEFWLGFTARRWATFDELAVAAAGERAQMLSPERTPRKEAAA